MSLESLFKITCGWCKHEAPISEWCKTGTGPLPKDTFQCPACKRAFKRQPKANRKAWDKFIEVVPAQSQL